MAGLSPRMTTARIHIDGALPAAEALARAQALLECVGPDRPALLYGAELSGAAVALGAYQHAPHALGAHVLALPALRRPTGGGAVWASEGVLYFALGLAHASVLMQCPPGKILNRNVRGFLAGVRSLGVPAHYFGRDFVSVANEPGAYIGWYEAGDGRVLLEFFVALDASFALPEGLSAYPQSTEPPLRGKRPTTLRAAGARELTPHDTLARLAAGYAKPFALELAAEPPSSAELARASALSAGWRVAPEDSFGLTWSDPHQEAIGFVSAGARLDARGCFEALRVGGDFYQRAECPAQLQARLLGEPANEERVGAALDAVYAAQPGAIEGVRRLTTLRDALLQAAQRASSG
jgi:lipoate-protein ligase A